MLEYLPAYVQVAGTRPLVTTDDTRRAIATHFHLNEGALELQRVGPPEDFLLRLPDHTVLQTALQGDRTVTTPAFKLALKPWNRLVNATHAALYHKVLIELEGIPLHVWNYTTAADLLRTYCSLESIDPDTAACRALTVFHVAARTTRPELIPSERILTVPEPTDEEAPFRWVKHTLKYTVKIRVRHLLVRMTPDSLPASPPSTPPSDSSSEDSSPQNPKRRRRGRGRPHQGRRREETPLPVDDSATAYSGVATPSERRRASRGGDTETDTCGGATTSSQAINVDKGVKAKHLPQPPAHAHTHTEADGGRLEALVQEPLGAYFPLHQYDQSNRGMDPMQFELMAQEKALSASLSSVAEILGVDDRAESMDTLGLHELTEGLGNLTCAGQRSMAQHWSWTRKPQTGPALQRRELTAVHGSHHP